MWNGMVSVHSDTSLTLKLALFNLGWATYDDSGTIIWAWLHRQLHKQHVLLYLLLVAYPVCVLLLRLLFQEHGVLCPVWFYVSFSLLIAVLFADHFDNTIVPYRHAGSLLFILYIYYQYSFSIFIITNLFSQVVELTTASAHKNRRLEWEHVTMYVKIETGQNFLPVLKIVTRTVQAA